MSPLLAEVCPKAPPGLQSFADTLMGWTKWGVLAIILFAAFASIGAMVVGRLGGMPRMGQGGATGLAVTVIAAVLFVTIAGIIAALVGSGC